jgi:hypothetical protein
LRVSVPVPVARDAVGLVSSNVGEGVLLVLKKRIVNCLYEMHI